MSGIASVLNIAKEALLAHQLSVQVASHNVANVDTPGYTRQTLGLTTNQGTPVSVGTIGNGVRGDRISRQYDQFMTQRIIDQTSVNSGYEAQKSALQVVGTIFNEAPGMALNDLMSNFWDSWQKLTDNPEVVASRQQVVQQGQLLMDQLQNMNSQITQARYDIGVSLDNGVGDINSLSAEIANLNFQITGAESENHQANDLRDQRDELTKELASLVDINYFEDVTTGSYTVMLNDGNSLVDTGTSWNVEWGNNQLYILKTNRTGDTVRTSIGNDSALGGKIGGWLDVRGELLEGDPDNYIGRLDSMANAMIREVNQLHSQGVGLVPFSEELIGAERADNTGALSTVVDTSTAQDTISAGTYTINDRKIGQIDGVNQTYGLAIGKTYNAAKAINDATTGVTAKMTTMVAGDAVTGLAVGETVDFTINGISINLTNSSGSAWDAATTSVNVVDAINTAIDTYNSDPDNPIDMTIEAVVGDGTNGGSDNSIVLFNSVAGDESRILIEGVEDDPTVLPDYTSESKLGLTNDSFVADKTHNTGSLTLFSTALVTINAGTNDKYLDHLGLGDAISTTSYATTPVSGLTNGTFGDFSFSLNDVSISVNIPGPAAATPAGTDMSAEEVANQMVTTINTYSGNTGVVALVGNGLNGGEQNTIIFKNIQEGDTSTITVANYDNTGSTANVVTPPADDWLKSIAGGGLDEDTPNDGEVIFDPSEYGTITASLQGLDYADELQLDGNSLGIWIYDADGAPVLPKPVTVNLERAKTMYDVTAAINKSLEDEGVNNFIKVDVQNNHLRFSTDDAGHQFAFTADSTNFLQVAGINTFLSGHSAGSFGVNEEVVNNLDKIAAGKITTTGQIFRGDNSNSMTIGNIQHDEYVNFIGGGTDTLDNFYNALVAEVGTRSRTVDRQIEYSDIMINQMNEIRDSTSGVSLDEEMANLIKFQHAYAAAAKLISAADEMYASLLTSIGS